MNPMLKTGCALAAALIAAGCMSTTPQLDARFGEAVNLAKAQQTLNPDASRNRDPVMGIDGRAARETIEHYEKSFQQTQTTSNPFVIGIGTGTGASGAGGQ